MNDMNKNGIDQILGSAHAMLIVAQQVMIDAAKECEKLDKTTQEGVTAASEKMAYARGFSAALRMVADKINDHVANQLANMINPPPDDKPVQ